MKQIIFHGGCHGCTQQEKHGTDFCYGCQYFDGDWELPSLNNEPPSDADLEREAVKMRMKNPIRRAVKKFIGL